MEAQRTDGCPYNTILKNSSEGWELIINTNWYNITNILGIKNENDLFLIVPLNNEGLNINIFSGKNQGTQGWTSIGENLTLEELITNINNLGNHKILIRKSKSDFFHTYEIFIPNDCKEKNISKIKYILGKDILLDKAKIKETIEEGEYYKLNLMLIGQNDEKIREWLGCLFDVLKEDKIGEHHFELFLETILSDTRGNKNILILLIRHISKFRPFGINKLIDPNTLQEIFYLKMNGVNILIKGNSKYINQIFYATEPESMAIYLEKTRNIEIYDISYTLH